MTAPLRVVRVATVLALVTLLAGACAQVDPTEAQATAVEAVPGRQAITAAQGEPHVLWFWGAN